MYVFGALRLRSLLECWSQALSLLKGSATGTRPFEGANLGLPEPWKDSNNGSSIGLPNLRHRSIRGFCFLDPPSALGCCCMRSSRVHRVHLGCFIMGMSCSKPVVRRIESDSFPRILVRLLTPLLSRAGKLEGFLAWLLLRDYPKSEPEALQ